MATAHTGDGRWLNGLSVISERAVYVPGDGCTFASAIAAGVAEGLEVVGQAKEYITMASGIH